MGKLEIRAEEVLTFMGTERKELCKVYLNLNMCNYQSLHQEEIMNMYIHIHTVTPHHSLLSIHLSNNKIGQYYNTSI